MADLKEQCVCVRFSVNWGRMLQKPKIESVLWRANDVKNTSFPGVTFVEDVACPECPSTSRRD
jgi:hypothetical protein